MESDTPIAEAVPALSTADRNGAVREATKRMAAGRTDSRIVSFLTNKGFTPEEAQDALAPMHQRIDALRPTFVAKQRKRKIFPVILIVFGVALLVLGLAVGRPQTLFIAAINIGIGIVNYNKVIGETFASTF